MKIYHLIDDCFNLFYRLKRFSNNFFTHKIVYCDYRLRGTIKSSFINGTRIVYENPITYLQLKEMLINRHYDCRLQNFKNVEIVKETRNNNRNKKSIRNKQSDAQ